MACPFLVGITSLMLSKHKKQEKEGKPNDCKTPEQIFNHLKRCSIDKGIEGKDSDYGYGIINIQGLLDTEEPKKPEEPEEPEEPENPEEPEEPEEPKEPIDKKTSWFKKNIAWVFFGIFLSTALIFLVFSQCSKEDVPKPPYVDEQGNIDWDKKFEEEKNNKK